MECDACGLTAPDRRRFHCPACARGTLYPLRLEHAELLLDKARLGKEVGAIVVGKTGELPSILSPGSADPSRRPNPKLQHEQHRTDLRKSKETVERILQRTYDLKSSIDVYRKHISEQKSALARRRDDIIRAKAKLKESRSAATSPFEKQTRKVKQRHESVGSDLVYSRASLCNIAASIVGLRPVSALSPPLFSGSVILPTYQIASLPIPDLRTLNYHPVSQVNVVLEQIIRLLSLACTYLSIRPPAEILAPTGENPQCWIVPPAASYDVKTKDSMSGSNLAADASPSGSQTQRSTSGLSPPQPRARPLFITLRSSESSRKPGTDEPKLPTLAREDQTQYAYFIEGVALLASNVAWLCSTQGVSGSSDGSIRWQNVCMLGQNLHGLFVDAADASARSLRHGKRNRKTASGKIAFGQRTHGSATGFLFSQAVMSAATFADPQIIRDALRSHLQADTQGAEWHVLGEDDFKSMDDERDVLVKGKGKRRSGPLGGDQGEIIDVPGAWGDEDEILARTEMIEGDERRRDSAHAWLKLRDRTSNG